MPDHTKSSKVSECEQSECAMPDAEAALKIWKKARKDLKQHMEKHGISAPTVLASAMPGTSTPA